MPRQYPTTEDAAIQRNGEYQSSGQGLEDPEDCFDDGQYSRPPGSDCVEDVLGASISVSSLCFVSCVLVIIVDLLYLSVIFLTFVSQNESIVAIR